MLSGFNQPKKNIAGESPAYFMPQITDLQAEIQLLKTKISQRTKQRDMLRNDSKRMVREFERYINNGAATSLQKEAIAIMKLTNTMIDKEISAEAVQTELELK